MLKTKWLLRACLVFFILAPPGMAQERNPGLVIPRLTTPPKLEDFLNMQAESEAARQMARVTDFRQWIPHDGQPASKPTAAYLGYDDKNLYVVFVCFDDPRQVRAHLSRREEFFPNDFVDVWLDTFNDRRRAYEFFVNPLGVQGDALADSENEDFSFDTLWYSRGQLTGQGYVVWIAIPFKSLRFSSANVQTWGINLQREINRNNEKSFWPYATSRVEGIITQNAPLKGLENISPGRNIQFIPYGILRASRGLDLRDPAQPRFESERAKPNAGVDSKLIIKDSMVLDLTLEPDFSQIESDEPQVTVSERFEVYFPEKRPFFIENANYFQTPINLFFTRRIANPQFGGRLTGKLGGWTLGALVADDRAPGKIVPPADRVAGKRAFFGIGRISRDIFKESNVGVMYTHRQFQGSYNRVASVDTRLKFTQTLIGAAQAVATSTRLLDGTYLAGPAFDAQLNRYGRSFRNFLRYGGRATNFQTDAGFEPRTDTQQVSNETRYIFYPKDKRLLNWGPYFRFYRIYDNAGTLLNWGYQPEMRLELPRQTYFNFGYAAEEETLRPKDFPVLLRNREYVRGTTYFYLESGLVEQFNFEVDYRWGKRLNFSPPAGVEPFLGLRSSLTLAANVRPVDRLRIENTYLLFRLRDPDTKASAFTNHIVRSKWNYQFTRELSARAIVQYSALLGNPRFTSLPTSKSVNADFLITYLLHPGTAVYAGYNTNLQNLDPALAVTESGLRRTRSRLMNDSRQFFVKVSYLLRF